MRKSSEPLPGGLVQETEKGQRILVKIKAIVSCLFPFRPESRQLNHNPRALFQ
jgi:hypothetical protein